MTRDGDAAVVDVVEDQVPGDEIVVGGAKLIGQKDPAGIPDRLVAEHHGVGHAQEMDPLTAVPTAVRRAEHIWRSRVVVAQVVTRHVIVENLHIRDRGAGEQWHAGDRLRHRIRVDREDALAFRSFHLEALDRDA